MGNIKVKVGYLQELISQLVSKADTDRTLKGLREVANSIGIVEDYLYKKIDRPIDGMNENATIALRESILDRIARHLRFRDFRAFMKSVTDPPDNQLLSCVGKYHSYIRENARRGAVLMSPARIDQTERGEFRLELNGPASRFLGTIELRDGCLFVLLKASTGKRFYHAYRIGNSTRPSLMQGVFAGVTTNAEPIGGRAVLLRVEEQDHSKKGQKTVISEMKKSKKPHEKLLAKYFEKYENNNIALQKSYAFSIDDLDDRD